MGFLGRFDPLAVEVGSRQIAAIVSNDNSIDVEHGHYLEDEILPKTSGQSRIPQQKVDDIFDNIAGHRLARVHS